MKRRPIKIGVPLRARIARHYHYGWYKNWRREMAHAIWQLSPRQYKVWRTILNKVNWTPGQFFVGPGRFVPVPAGSFITSHSNLAKDAGRDVTVKVVRRALHNLEALGSIALNQSLGPHGPVSVDAETWTQFRAQLRAQSYTEITVVNWRRWQAVENDTGADEDTDMGNNIRR